MSRSTRREFLATTSVALAGVAVGARSLSAIGTRVVNSSEWSAAPFLSERPTPEDFQLLANAAIDAARAAGAAYADVRVGDQLFYRVHVGLPPIVPGVSLSASFAYGIRVLVDGMWAFVHGTVPNADRIAFAARNAVATARGNARSGAVLARADFASAPSVTGTWTSPMKIDPFTIPAEEQLALLDACGNAIGRILGGTTGTVPGWGGQFFEWLRDTRVFASTEGSMVTQVLHRSHPKLAGGGDRGMGATSIQIPSFVAQTGGYETVLNPDLQDQLKAAAEEAARFARMPRRPMDMGRYPVVFDGFALAKIFGETVAPALELDRVLGYEADASGTSIFAPLQNTLGVQLFSPMLNVSAGRALPSVQAVQWDDEGVEPHEYTLIRDGRVVDFHTSRQTAPMLRAWYDKQGMPMRSHGCAVAVDPSDPVAVRAPHVTVAAGATAATLDDLCKDISRGILVRETGWNGVSTDQQFGSGSISDALMFEIQRGKIVRRIRDTTLDFRTRSLLKNITALGDASTVRTSDSRIFKGQPWVAGKHSTTAPAGLFKDVSVLSTGRAI